MKHMLTRMLAFGLSAILFFGSVTPAYAAEVDVSEDQALEVVDEETTEDVETTEEVETTETEEVTVEETEVVEEETEEVTITAETTVQTEAALTTTEETTVAAPTFTYDGEEYLSVTNNHSTDVYVYYMLVDAENNSCSEEKSLGSAYVGSFYDCIKDLVTPELTTGNYYLAGYAVDIETENKSEMSRCETPISVSVEEKENVVLEKNETDGILYVKDYPSDNWNSVVVEIEVEKDGTKETKTESLSFANDYFCLDADTVEKYDTDYDSWSVVSLVAKCHECSQTKIDFNVETATSFSKTTATIMSPSLVLSPDGGILNVTNRVGNEAVKVEIYAVSADGEVEILIRQIDALDAYTGTGFYITSVVDKMEVGSLESGSSYVIKSKGYGKTSNLTSEFYTLENFTINLEKTQSENKAVVKTGDCSGKVYFTDYQADEYYNAKVNVTYGESGTKAITLQTEELDGKNVFYFDGKALTAEVGTWQLGELEMTKIAKSSTQCDVFYSTIADYTYETYEEPRTTAPSLERSGLLCAPRIFIKNNSSESERVYYGIVTQAQIDAGLEALESTSQLRPRDLDPEQEVFCDINKMIVEDDLSAGRYYFVAYTAAKEGYYASEIAKWECPIDVTRTTLSDVTVTTQIGDVSGYHFIMSDIYSPLYYDCAVLKFSGKNLNGAGVVLSREMQSQWNKFCDDIDTLEAHYQSLDKTALLLLDTNIADNIYTADFFEINQFDDNETDYYIEPQAPAPKVEPYTDTQGNVIGLKLTNNMTHDSGSLNICVREATWKYDLWSMEVAAGESVNVLFEELDFDVLIDQGVSAGTYSLECYAYDYEEVYNSKYIKADFTSKIEITKYDGTAIKVSKDVVSDSSEERYYFYLPVNAFPENVELNRMFVSSDSYQDLFTEFELTEDKKNWATVRGASEDVTPGYIDYVTSENNTEGFTVSIVKVPEEKLEVSDINKKILFLDKDYYDAFIASGGSVTLEDGIVNVSKEGSSWTLKYLYEKIKGSDLYGFVESISNNVLEKANKYWNGYVAKHFYALDESSDTGYREISEEAVSDQDIVLVKYEPEVVWVQSIKLTAPKTMKKGESVTIKATVDYGQSKYPAGRDPQLRFKVDDPSTATIDPVTGKLTVLKNNCVVKVTVIADEALREQYGSYERVLKTVEIEVGHVHYYDNPKIKVTKKATLSNAGNEKWTCECGKTKNVTIPKIKSVKLSKTSYTYDGTAKKPTVTIKDKSGATLVSGTDYKVTYAKGRKNAGTYKVTIKFKGDYSGTVTKNFKINKKAITEEMLSDISARTYNGKAQTPSVTVKYGSTTLKKNTDYTVSYKNNTKAGKATVTITGKGNYSGSESVKFTIKRKSIENFTVSVNEVVVYTGKAQKPAVTVKNGKKKLVSGTDYKVTYSSNKNPGTATVEVTGKGNYSGTLNTTFIIVPKAPTISSVKSPSKGTLQVKWKKDNGASGYLIQYSTNKKFNKYETISIDTNTDVNEKITGLKSGKTYYVRMLSGKDLGDGSGLYGPFSAVKSVKVK